MQFPGTAGDGRHAAVNRLRAPDRIGRTISMPAVGEFAEEFELKDSAGTTRRLVELAARGPLVLIFYRGAW